MDGRRCAQLPLGLELRPGRTFANFVEGPNALALAAVRSRARDGGAPCFVWGAPGTGKTHLLEAACSTRRAIYLPLRRLRDAGAREALTDLSRVGLVCVDDVDAVAGDRGWERALFGLYEGIEAAAGTLIASGASPPAGLGLGLPDLASRFGASLVVQLRPLDDRDRHRALLARAGEMGLDPPAEVLDYLLRRCSRDMHHLFDLLALLDRSSLAAKRRLSVPFVREVLAGGAGPPGQRP